MKIGVCVCVIVCLCGCVVCVRVSGNLRVYVSCGLDVRVCVSKWEKDCSHV